MESSAALASQKAVLIEELSWPEVGALIVGGERLCVLPVGATEQHGPHLPTGTDTLIAEAVCRTASARTGVPLLPTLAITSSSAHTTTWPGTLSLSPRQLIEVVIEVGTWVSASGFQRLLIVNAHGGNRAALTVAVEELRWQGFPRVGLAHWFSLTPELEAEVFRDGSDGHANAAETSLIMHLRPDLVQRDAIRDDPDRTPGLAFSYTVAETSAEGLTGKPSLGTAAEGARLFESAVVALVELIERARREEPPVLPKPQRRRS